MIAKAAHDPPRRQAKGSQLGIGDNPKEYPSSLPDLDCLPIFLNRRLIWLINIIPPDFLVDIIKQPCRQRQIAVLLFPLRA
jgi:hypothetical protein